MADTAAPTGVTTTAPASQTVPRATIGLLAFAVGAVIANLYYAQPLEDTLAHVFAVSSSAVGLALTVIQIGYAVGIATLVPLGDLLERRRLIVPMLAVNVVGLVLMASFTWYPLFLVAGALVGLTAVAVQVMVPFAADLAPPEQRGRLVSTVMSGLLIGVLVSRTVSGLIAGVAGWHAVFWFAAAVTAGLTGLLWWRLPRVAPKVSMPYPKLLRSVVDLLREEPVLRLRMLYGGLTFAAFGAFWTSAGFMLAGAPYHWTAPQIGAFALVGAAGAIAARFAGRLADRGHVHRATIGFLVVTALSYGLIQLGHSSVIALVAGVVIMDLGTQGTHISNQSIIFALRPEARSRINTAYMCSYFVAGSLGGGISALVYPAFGWTGVCVTGFVLCLAGAVVWLFQARRVPAAA